MTQSAGQAGTARLAASLLLVAALLPTAAAGGDRALADFIGYSNDGRYFAFEEYGIQDGSGFPYANIYFIDLPADAWLPGTPVRVRIEGEGADLPAAREEAREQAADRLESLGIATPAHLIALNGDGEPGDGLSLVFGAVGYMPGELQDERRLSLEIFDAPSPHDCTTFLGEEAKGYALLLENDGAVRELHRDTGKLPESRGCPTTYRIYGVITPHDSGSLDDAVAIVSVYPFGFEGPDRRFLAVPLGE
jgi:predicted secreted protein